MAGVAVGIGVAGDITCVVVGETVGVAKGVSDSFELVFVLVVQVLTVDRQSCVWVNAKLVGDTPELFAVVFKLATSPFGVLYVDKTAKVVVGEFGGVAEWVSILGQVVVVIADVVVLFLKGCARLFDDGAVVVTLLVGVVDKAVVLPCVERVVNDTGGGWVLGLVVAVVTF